MVEPSTDICRLRNHGDIVRQIGHAQKACQTTCPPTTVHVREIREYRPGSHDSLAFGGEQVDVVDTTNWYAGGWTLLRTIPQPRLLTSLWSDVSPPRIAPCGDPLGSKLVGAAMSQVAIHPASPEPGRLDCCDPPLQRLWRPDAPCDMPESRAPSFGNLQRMMILLFIAAQVGRVSRPLVSSNPSRSLKKPNVSSRSGVRIPHAPNVLCRRSVHPRLAISRHLKYSLKVSFFLFFLDFA